MKKVNDEVYYNESDTLALTKSDIDDLIEKGLKNPRERARICTHLSPDSKTQEMVIVHSRKAYVRAHKHMVKPESFHIITGKVDVYIYKDNGEVIKKIEMGDYSSGKPFYYRIEKNIYHSMIIKSDVLVFVETTTGPFRSDETEFPKWAPLEENKNEVNVFLDRIEKDAEIIDDI